MACFPYKATTMMAFIQLVKAPWRILKDFIQIMKMELVKLYFCIDRHRTVTVNDALD